MQTRFAYCMIKSCCWQATWKSCRFLYLLQNLFSYMAMFFLAGSWSSNSCFVSFEQPLFIGIITYQFLIFQNTFKMSHTLTFCLLSSCWLTRQILLTGFSYRQILMTVIQLQIFSAITKLAAVQIHSFLSFCSSHWNHMSLLFFYQNQIIYQKNVQLYQNYKKLVPVIHRSNLNMFFMILHLIPFALPLLPFHGFKTRNSLPA